MSIPTAVVAEVEPPIVSVVTDAVVSYGASRQSSHGPD